MHEVFHDFLQTGFRLGLPRCIEFARRMHEILQWIIGQQSATGGRQIKPDSPRIFVGSSAYQIALCDQTLNRLRRRATCRGVKIGEARDMSGETVGPGEEMQGDPLRLCQAAGRTISISNPAEL